MKKVKINGIELKVMKVLSQAEIQDFSEDIVLCEDLRIYVIVKCNKHTMYVKVLNKMPVNLQAF